MTSFTTFRKPAGDAAMCITLNHDRSRSSSSGGLGLAFQDIWEILGAFPGLPPFSLESIFDRIADAEKDRS